MPASRSARAGRGRTGGRCGRSGRFRRRWHRQSHRGHPSRPPTDWIKTPIDAFILAGLKAKGLAPAPAADAATLIRRVTFDLTGLPPTPEAVDAFVAAIATDPLAYETLVDRLLASPQYGERWGRHWLDVVRFGESQGYETNLPRPGAWPYRDYVIRAFNRDTPFPQFVARATGRRTQTRQPTGSRRRRPGFWSAARTTSSATRRSRGCSSSGADDLDDMITATGTTFLGLTIQCARCHDHKFDPIAQKDYYGFQAIFAGVNHAERELAAPDFESASARGGRDHVPSWPGSNSASMPTSRWPGPIGICRCARWSTPGAMSSGSRR